VIVGNIWRKPVPTQASIVRGIAGVGEFGENLLIYDICATYLVENWNGCGYVFVCKQLQYIVRYNMCDFYAR